MSSVAVWGDAGLRGAIHDAVDGMIDDWNRPAFRAGAAVTAASTFVLARLGTRPLLAVLVAASLGVAAQNLYEMAEEITAKLDGAHATGQD